MPLVRRVRSFARGVAERYGGLPRPSSQVDTPTPEAAHDITRLWLRSSRPFGARRVTDSAGEAVICMTTRGRRLADVWVAIESIGRGTVRPARLILWLDEPRRLPARLKRLRARGIEIRFTPAGNRVHTKYWPYIESEPLERPLVLADDDIVYPPTWLEVLLREHHKTPDLVVAYRAHVIGMTGEDFTPYAQWRSCDDDTASFAHLATSVSGQVLPVALQRALHAEGVAFRELAPTNDDIWIHRTAVGAGIRTRQALPGQRHWPFVPGSQGEGLNIVNVVGGANDAQLATCHTAVTRQRIRDDIDRAAVTP
ncbi:MAG: hypothetical protein ABS62_03025 [Microbacterium sp. SCN 70-200]|uniref:glycosyltransferase family A protein n=1 Tax=unclassified Microbacterium TaxID=2609290 RepID=UPI000869AB54|nr:MULTISPECIES: glycosyltransferase family A protein [unclassified Microbacterium]MBN9213838.1 glycosyltransferase family 2 protein [Microbacterium sp.]ODT42391.1 MAG: hypothetical protein ABS62_03025 [Microbacterium sp. SCN 70-200]OJV85481.1 MAG: hypothetical protein BGO46_09240 [Microbacterium sp. 70-16]